jgi:hypothetical protein
MMLPRPRAYVDWAVPLDDQGREIGVCGDAATYRRYIEWLADYLFLTEIPIPENQQALVAEFEARDGIASAVFWLSDDLGMTIWDAEWVEEAFLDGLTREEIRECELVGWNLLSDEERQIWGDPEADFFISEADYQRIGSEALEARKVPARIRHADIPYRPVLAKLLKAVSSREDRIAHLNYFYQNLNDCLSK